MNSGDEFFHKFYSGAATGTGGRIRDIQAVGRGGNPIAGTVGYAVGNLFIPGTCMSFALLGHSKFVFFRNFALSLKIEYR